MTYWLLRAWRWRVEVRPVPDLLLYAAIVAAITWLPLGGVRSVQRAVLVLIAVCVVVAVAAFVSAWRQVRRRA